MASVSEIRDYFNHTIPFYMAMDFDNVGLLAGFCHTEVSRVLTALDITEEVIEEAIAVGAQLIVSHHPLIFTPLKRVTDDDPVGKRMIRLLTGGVSAICLHTNLDSADGGVNDILLAKLGAAPAGLLESHGFHPDGRPYGVARLGTMPAPTAFRDFLDHTRKALQTPLRYVDGGKPVSRIACCGGAGGGEIELAIEAGCDTYVTADLKYDHFLRAKQAGLNLIDGDHFCTENVVVPHIRELLLQAYPGLDVRVSAVHRQTVQFY